jgi:transcriptional regulator GlxA family with amidase domain
VAYNLLHLFQEIDSRISVEPGLSLRQLARILEVERHTLQRSVHLATGGSFRTYRQRKVLDVALDSLATKPNVSIKVIAVGLGYQSSQAFSRFIRQATGFTPTQVRQKSLEPVPTEACDT